ncbi:hypothetical protein ACFU6I_46470 [Streptomyces sp. NPDC057486]|uniref:hypothetical protein n=1 Tax=Streptomyces sp. NPDC057486 TaxID=3346145 RepID=UPI0036967BCB
MRGTLVGWVPIATDASGDAALLELESPVDCTPAPLACPPALSGHRFSVHGFPHGDPAARQATGVLRGASGPMGPWVQLDAESSTGWPIEMGFSGAPVFDHTREAVVGIVVMRDDHRAGHMLPMSYLRTLWPEVRRNCGWRLDLDTSYRTHWRPRARGSEIDSDTGEWFFTGRTEARRVIREWLEGRALAEHPILLVTGGPGSGKSALLAHALVSADPQLAPTVPTSGPRPPTGAFDIALHLRGRTHREVTTQLAGVLGVAAGEPAELLAEVGEFPPGERFCVLADAVEEAASLEEARQIATLLRQLANTGRFRVLAAVRTAPAGTSRARILSNFGRSAPRIDLEDSRYLHRPDIAEYVIRRLASTKAGSDRYRAYTPDQLRATGEAVARKARYNFLIAQLTARWLTHPSAPPTGPGDPDWEDELPETVGQAMDAYLDTCRPDTETVRRLLTALAYARGDGLPRSNAWLSMADALGSGVGHTARDLEKIFHSAAHYLVERVNEDSGPRTYRLYHNALDQHLRDECERVLHAPEAAISAALMDAVPVRDGERDWAGSDTYTRDHLADHAAAGGQLDSLTSDAEYLVHATPRTLVPHLRRTETETARLAAAVYRASIHLHTTATPALRRQVLALDAARAGAASLQQQLTYRIPEGSWVPRWATGADFSPALCDTLTGHTARVSAVACTLLGGRPVAVTAGGDDGAVRMWDLATGTPLGPPMTGHSERIHSVACTVLGGRPVAVTTGGGDGTMRVWDLATGTPLRQLTVSTGWVDAAACTNLDGRSVAMVTSGAIVRVWDLATGTALGHLTGRTGWVHAVACTVLGGRPVAVTGGDVAVRVWDLATGTALGPPMMGQHPGRVVAVACTSVNGTPVAVTTGGSGTVSVWDLATGTPLAQLTGHTNAVRAVACTFLDGRPVAVTGGDDWTVRVWDLATGTPLGAPMTGHTGPVGAVACTVLDGRPVAVTGGDDGTVRVWDLAIGATLPEPITGHTSTVSAVACTSLADVPVAVTGAGDRTVRVWDLATGTPLGAPMTGHTGRVGAVTCTVLDGRPVAVTGGDYTVRVWDLATGTPLPQPTVEPTHSVEAVACADLDGRPVGVTTAGLCAVRVWDLATGTRLARPAIAHPGWAPALACTSLNGRPVGVTNGSGYEAQVWDLATGTPLARLTGHTSTLRAAACTVLDGIPVAVTGSYDRTVRVWDLATGTPLGAPMTGHTGTVSAVACTALDGVPVAVTTGDDETVRVWNLRTCELLGLIAATGARAVAITAQGYLVVGMSRDVAVFTRRSERAC